MQWQHQHTTHNIHTCHVLLCACMTDASMATCDDNNLLSKDIQTDMHFYIHAYIHAYPRGRVRPHRNECVHRHTLDTKPRAADLLGLWTNQIEAFSTASNHLNTYPPRGRWLLWWLMHAQMNTVMHSRMYVSHRHTCTPPTAMDVYRQMLRNRVVKRAKKTKNKAG